MMVAKLQNRVHVYSVEGEFPMFFDIDGRGSEIFPSGMPLYVPTPFLLDISFEFLQIYDRVPC